MHDLGDIFASQPALSDRSPHESPEKGVAGDTTPRRELFSHLKRDDADRVRAATVARGEHAVDVALADPRLGTRAKLDACGLIINRSYESAYYHFRIFLYAAKVCQRERL